MKVFIKTNLDGIITEKWICDKNPVPDDKAIIELSGVDSQAKILGMKYNGKGKPLTGETVEVEKRNIFLEEILEEINSIKAMLSIKKDPNFIS